IGVGRRIDLTAHQGIELSELDVDPSRREDAGNVDLGEELREVDADGVHLAEALRAVDTDPRAQVIAGKPAEQAVGDEPRRIDPHQEIEVVADVPLVPAIEGSLHDEVELIEPVVVGPPVEVRAEVDAIAGAGGVPRETLLEPAVDARVDPLETVA